MTLDDWFHLTFCVICLGLGLVVPVIQEDGQKRGEGSNSVRAVTRSNTISSSGTSAIEHWGTVSKLCDSESSQAYRFRG